MPSTSSVIVFISANLPESASVMVFSNTLKKNMNCMLRYMFLDFFFDFDRKL